MPGYRREQRWRPMRRRTDLAIVLGMVVASSVAVATFVVRPREDVFTNGGPESQAKIILAKLVRERFAAWRDHHAGCPHRLAELVPGPTLDPWHHAMHYTCDVKLAHGGRFAVISAGEDGWFGTTDDIEDHE